MRAFANFAYPKLGRTSVFAALGSLLTATAQADVVVSTAQTQNMSCSGGVCSPTAIDAVLNVTDLENLLASGSVEVTTTGSGVQADNIAIGAGLQWSGASSLELDAYQSIAIGSLVKVSGASGLQVITDDGGVGGRLSFTNGGRISFKNLSSPLSINGISYSLVGDIASLAGAITANPSGDYALASNYSAKNDGTYSSAPIQTVFSGSFEGLGNAISKLKINDGNTTDSVGLFAQIGTGARVSDLRLNQVSVLGTVTSMGSLAGTNNGTIAGVSASGTLSAGYVYQTYPLVGGLVGNNLGTIAQSSSAANVSGVAFSFLGGLVGESSGEISLSYASGTVTGTNDGHAPGGYAAGLVGELVGGSIDQSFATGSVAGVQSWAAAGLVGLSDAAITHCYATGAVTAQPKGGGGSVIGLNYIGTAAQAYGTGLITAGRKGGFVLADESSSGSLTDAYWDTTTTGETNLAKGAGNMKNDPGITGLDDDQLKSGLPAGFDPAIWAQDANINNGWPYLINNPQP